MSTLTVLSPNAFADAMLVSSSIAEDEYAAWSSATTYADADRVIYQHRIYESTAGANLNHNPLTDASDPAWWVDVGPSNLYACLDNETSTTTTAATGVITYVMRPGRFASFALVGIQATSVYIKIQSDVDGTVYEGTTTIKDTSDLADWYAYFYSTIRLPTEFVLENLPALGDVTVTITVTNLQGTASIGTLVFGWTREIGLVQYGAKASIYDFSKKETDDFGVTTFVRRAFSKRADLPLVLTDTQVDYVQTVLAELRAQPCLWRGGNGKYAVLTIFGFYRDFSIDIRYPTMSACTLTLEGLT